VIGSRFRVQRFRVNENHKFFSPQMQSRDENGTLNL
jgi:hypothetical protein